MNLSLFRSLYCRVADAYGLMAPNGTKTIRSPLTDDLVRKHLEGEERIGAFFLDHDGMADQLVIDIDEHAPALAKNVQHIFDGLGIHAYLEASKSKGYHVRTHWQPAVPAVELRRVGAHVTREAGIPDAEIFPKQDQRRGENGLGNFMWLPLHGLSLKEGKTVAVDHTNGMCPLPDQWTFLENIRRNSPETLAAAIAVIEGDEFLELSEKIARPNDDEILEGNRNEALTSLAGSMRRKGMTLAAIQAALVEENAARCKPPLLEPEVCSIAASIMKYSPAPLHACSKKVNETLILDRQDPMKNAQRFLETQFLHEEGRTLHHHKGAFFEWTGTHYPEMDEGRLRAMLYGFLHNASCWVKRGDDEELEDFKPTRKTVDDALDALKAIVHLPASCSPSMWIDGEKEISAGDMVACKNGLVHLPTKRLISHSPRFFTHNALPFDYLPDSGP